MTKEQTIREYVKGRIESLMEDLNTNEVDEEIIDNLLEETDIDYERVDSVIDEELSSEINKTINHLVELLTKSISNDFEEI